MSPRERDGPGVETDLQARLDSIALQARERNPGGFRLAPVIQSHTAEVKNFRNVISGQSIVLLENARNVPAFLQVHS